MEHSPKTPSLEQVTRIIKEAYAEIGRGMLGALRVESVFRDPISQTLFVVVSDRVNLSRAIGPSGRIRHVVKKKLGIDRIKVVTEPQVFFRDLKRRLAFEAIKGLKMELSHNQRLFADEVLSPLLMGNLPKRRVSCAVALAYSGGVDSTAALVLLSRFVEVKALTIAPGPYMIPKGVRKRIESITSSLGVRHEYLESSATRFWNLFAECLEKAVHPCGRCKTLMEEVLLRHARETGAEVLVYGDLLPIASESVSLRSEILVVRLPAALALDKQDCIHIAEEAGYRWSPYTYGCPMLKQIHRAHPHTRYTSIQRILRKTYAGVLTPSQSLRYIRSIMG